MSRSRRKYPIKGIVCCRSEKPYKQIAHRCKRRRVRQAVHNDPLRETLPHRYEINNNDPWGFGKDGKWWFDRERFPEWLRK